MAERRKGFMNLNDNIGVFFSFFKNNLLQENGERMGVGRLSLSKVKGLSLSHEHLPDFSRKLVPLKAN